VWRLSGLTTTLRRRHWNRDIADPFIQPPNPAQPSRIRDVFFAANSREQLRTFAQQQHPADFLHSIRRPFRFSSYNNQTYDGNR
jgi:hypothetical protein